MNVHNYHLQYRGTSKFYYRVLTPNHLDSQVIHIDDVPWSTCFKQPKRYSNLSSQVFVYCKNEKSLRCCTTFDKSKGWNPCNIDFHYALLGRVVVSNKSFLPLVQIDSKGQSLQKFVDHLLCSHPILLDPHHKFEKVINKL